MSEDYYFNGFNKGRNNQDDICNPPETDSEKESYNRGLIEGERRRKSLEEFDDDWMLNSQ